MVKITESMEAFTGSEKKITLNVENKVMLQLGQEGHWIADCKMSPKNKKKKKFNPCLTRSQILRSQSGILTKMGRSTRPTPDPRKEMLCPIRIKIIKIKEQSHCR